MKKRGGRTVRNREREVRRRAGVPVDVEVTAAPKEGWGGAFWDPVSGRWCERRISAPSLDNYDADPFRSPDSVGYHWEDPSS